MLVTTLISHCLFAQQLERMQEALSKETFPTASAVLKIREEKGIKEEYPIDKVMAVVANEPESKISSMITEYIPNPAPLPVIRPQHLGNTPIFISVVEKGTKKILNSEVKIIDREKYKLLGSVKTNSYCSIQDPRSKSGDLIFFISAFGFTDAMEYMNYHETERDTLKPTVTLFGNFFMLTFEMTRIKPGTPISLSGVYFFNDAAIMSPSSKSQLHAVLDKLNENPQVKIRIEGHTNGEPKGDITTPGPSKNYFGLTTDQRTRKGSAKELSEARAEVIKSWLIDHGVARARISTFGWGSDKPLYQANSPSALRNSRVEVLIEEN